MKRALHIFKLWIREEWEFEERGKSVHWKEEGKGDIVCLKILSQMGKGHPFLVSGDVGRGGFVVLET